MEKPIVLEAGRKRKRDDSKQSDAPSSVTLQGDLEALERQAGEPKHFNNIVSILHMAYPNGQGSLPNEAAVMTLCRVFYRLLMEGRFRETTDKNEETVRKWLRARLNEYVGHLSKDMTNRQLVARTSRVNLVMKLVQGQVSSQGHQQWRTGIFAPFLRLLVIQKPENNQMLESFMSDYFAKYDDVRFSTLMLLS
jgi:hypothetical protein